MVSRFRADPHTRDDLGVIALSGDIDSGADEALTAAYDALAGTGHATVLLNFEDVRYINSTGIALIVGLLARARMDGGGILCCGLSDHYLEIFEITRLVDFMQMVPDEDAAVAGRATVEERTEL